MTNHPLAGEDTTATPCHDQHPTGVSTASAIPNNQRETTVWFGIGIIGLIIWIAIAFWPARVAARKGHSFIGYFLLSLLFFPLSLIMAYVVQDRSLV